LTVLDGWRRTLYLACDKASSERVIFAKLATNADPIRQDEVDAALKSLVSRGLVYQDGSSYLALAVSLDAYRPTVGAMAALAECVKSTARNENGRTYRVPLSEYLLVAQE
jgi:hypothetical protein